MTITPTKHPEITPFRWFVWLLSCAFAGMQATAAAEPGLDLTLRRLVESPGAPNPWEVKEQRATWDPNRTAVVVCDMWNAHWCKGATARVAEMAPRMNSVLNALRQRGVLILHCPSETMSFYKDHPGRKLAQSAPKVDVQAQLQACASHTRQEDLAHPIDSSDGGCDCQPQCPQGPYPWTREIATLEIKDGDAITDSVEAYYLMRQRGITNALIMGVHENMCVLNRAFAIKQMVRLGQNIALMRDLTDTMYNSRHPPFVDHFIGNDLMTWHIEKYWCPTVTSDQILGGQPFHFAADKSSPRVFHNEAPRLSRIRVAVDHRTFETETGRPFVPFGVTYFHPDTGWAPQVWKKFDPAATAQDFARLRALGANCARVFISYGSFLSETNAPDPAGLAKFDQFLALAEAAGLYVHPTGPDHWEGTPSWAHGDRIADEVMLGALENFWRVFAARYRDRPALFAYDLRNEPEVAWDTPVLRKKWKKWLLVKHGSEAKAAEFLGVNAELLRGDDAPPPEAKEAPGDTRLLAYQHFREDIADTWTRRQVAAIKAADPKALVTVGLIQWSVPSVLPAVKHYAGFSPKRQAPLLDFMEVPERSNSQTSCRRVSWGAPSSNPGDRKRSTGSGP